jgi:hypothetical protein
MSAYTINEGQTVNLSLNTTNFGVTNSGTVPYSIAGTGITSGDISIPLTGNINVTNGVGTLSFTVLADTTTEGGETLTVTCNPVGYQCNSVNFSILDTSTTPVSYTLNTNKSVVNEGDSFSVTMQATANVTATIPYTVTGINAADISNGTPLTGNFVFSNSNTATIQFQLANDVTVNEGTETLVITAGGMTRNVTVNDTSYAPVSYSLTSSADAVNEGGSVSFTFTAVNLPSDITCGYTIAGNGITSADLSGAPLTGSFTTVGGTKTIGPFTIAADAATEGDETFQFIVNGISGVDLRRSVVIRDTSQTPTVYSIASDKSIMNEGESVTFTFYSSTPKIVSFVVNGVSPSDVTSGALSGTLNITSGSASHSIALANNNFTDGDRQINFVVTTPDNQGFSSIVTVRDTSKTKETTAIWVRRAVNNSMLANETTDRWVVYDFIPNNLPSDIEHWWRSYIALSVQNVNGTKLQSDFELDECKVFNGSFGGAIGVGGELLGVMSHTSGSGLGQFSFTVDSATLNSVQTCHIVLKIKQDGLTEDVETFFMRASLGSRTFDSSEFTVIDSSTTVIPEISVTSDKEIIAEGQTVKITASTFNSGSTVPYLWSAPITYTIANIAATDVNIPLTGTLTQGANGIAELFITALDDKNYGEGTERFQVYITFPNGESRNLTIGITDSTPDIVPTDAVVNVARGGVGLSEALAKTMHHSTYTYIVDIPAAQTGLFEYVFDFSGEPSDVTGREYITNEQKTLSQNQLVVNVGGAAVSKVEVDGSPLLSSDSRVEQAFNTIGMNTTSKYRCSIFIPKWDSNPLTLFFALQWKHTMWEEYFGNVGTVSATSTEAPAQVVTLRPGDGNLSRYNSSANAAWGWLSRRNKVNFSSVSTADVTGLNGSGQLPNGIVPGVTLQALTGEQLGATVNGASFVPSYGFSYNPADFLLAPKLAGGLAYTFIVPLFPANPEVSSMVKVHPDLLNNFRSSTSELVVTYSLFKLSYSNIGTQLTGGGDVNFLAGSAISSTEIVDFSKYAVYYLVNVALDINAAKNTFGTTDMSVLQGKINSYMNSNPNCLSVTYNISSGQVSDSYGGTLPFTINTSSWQFIINNDPVAQTFFVDRVSSNEGCFVKSVDVFFKKKSSSVPVTLQLRPVVNGYPSSNTVLPFGAVTLAADNIIASSTPDVTKYTRFEFSDPVYLPPGEYSVVMITNTTEYETYVAELGGFRLDDTSKRISTQAYTGSFFESQNGSTWSANQNVDLMFRINRCSFKSSGSVLMIPDNDVQSMPVDLFYVGGEMLDFAATNVDMSYNVANTGFKPYMYETNQPVDTRVTIPGRNNGTAYNSPIVFKADVKTTNDYISPVLDTERISGVYVNNIVNSTATNETLPQGGTAYAKYLTRRVTLDKNFYAQDLRVLMAASVPSECNVRVFYKVLPVEDNATPFDLQPYYEMVPEYSQTVVPGTFGEVKFKPSFVDSNGTPSCLENDGYFSSFVIKVVMESSDTTKVPLIRDLRVMALDL